MAESLRTVIVGTKHRPPEAMASLSKMVTGEHLNLHREPENAYDINAVAVYRNGVHVGYVPGRANRDLAAAMDQGCPVSCVVDNDPIVQNGEVIALPRIIIKWLTQDPSSPADLRE